MFLRKIKDGLYYQKSRRWFIWFSFILLLFGLTRLLMSLDLVRKWGASGFDLFMEIGFYYFLSLLEALFVSAALGGVQIGIEKITRRNLDLPVQVILACALVVPFVNLAFAIFELSTL